MENIYWKKTVGTLISSIWIYTLAGIAASITGLANTLLNPSGLIGMLGSIGENNTPALSMGDIIEGLFSMLVLVGYYLFFRSLTRFAHLQSDKQDRENVIAVRTAYILLMIALFADFIPLIGWLVSLTLIIISYVKMFSGYRGLKRSVTFPPEAREGASTLYSCSIWMLVGSVLGCIPFIGSLVEGIITLVVFFMVLAAWGHIKASAPTMTPEEETAFVHDEVPVYKQVLGDGVIALFFIMLMGVLLGLLRNYILLEDPLFPYIAHLPAIAAIGVYIWLLSSSKIQLNIMAKIGLGMLILECINGMTTWILQGLEIVESVKVLSNISIAVWAVGLILFIWKTQASRAIKLIVTLYPIVNLVLWQILWPFAFSRLYDYATFINYELVIQMAYPVWSAIVVLFFIVLCVFVAKWRKQSDHDINS